MVRISRGCETCRGGGSTTDPPVTLYHWWSARNTPRKRRSRESRIVHGSPSAMFRSVFDPDRISSSRFTQQRISRETSHERASVRSMIAIRDAFAFSTLRFRVMTLATVAVCAISENERIRACRRAVIIQEGTREAMEKRQEVLAPFSSGESRILYSRISAFSVCSRSLLHR